MRTSGGDSRRQFLRPILAVRLQNVFLFTIFTFTFFQNFRIYFNFKRNLKFHFYKMMTSFKFYYIFLYTKVLFNYWLCIFHMLSSFIHYSIYVIINFHPLHYNHNQLSQSQLLWLICYQLP